MAMLRYVFYFVALSVVIIGLATFLYGDEEEAQTSYKWTDGQINFSTPSLSDEDYHSPVVPKKFRCSVCHAIAYQLEKALAKEQSKYKKNKRLSEVVYLDLLDQRCTGDWESYGIKKIKGVNHFTGDGLPYVDEPGLTQMGGKWPHRLTSECQNILGEVGEDETYDAFYKGVPLQEFICKKSTSYCSHPHDEM